MPAEPKTKHQKVVAALRWPRGATLDKLVQITGWKRASVRGCLATLKIRRGLTITSEVVTGKRRYRIVKAAP